MKIILALLLGYAVLFRLVHREGFEIGDTLEGFGVLAQMIILGVQLVNWLFGANFADTSRNANMQIRIR